MDLLLRVSLAWACSHGGQVAGLGLVPQKSVTQAWLVPAPVKVTGLVLVQYRSLPWVCSCGGWLGTATTEVAFQAWSSRCCWLRPGPVEVIVSGLALP